MQNQITENKINQYLSNVRIGEPQTYHNLILFPLQAAQNGVMSFITLGEAVASGTFTVTEISNQGSVPELLVTNKGDAAVLLVDGEELIGAKQNRVLNTSVLIQAKSETKIPVSCVEQGRWTYTSTHFSPSQHIMAMKMRALKIRSVSDSLNRGAAFQSNQGEVWHGVHQLQAKAKMAFHSSAMNDVFKAYDVKLKECLAKFPCASGQQGLLVLQNGQITGLDLISRPEVYARLHEKFVRSYVLEALMEQPGEPENLERARDKAVNFLTNVSRAEEQKFRSAGYGWDHRVHADDLAGNALVADDHVIHAGIFKVEPNIQAQPQAQQTMSFAREMIAHRGRFMRQ
jgi:hypothetical protein